MFTNKPLESYFFAIYEPLPPDLFGGLIGKVSFCHASRSAPCGYLPLCVHSVGVNDEGRLRLDLVEGDPPSIRSPRVFALYQLAIGALGRRNENYDAATALYWGKDGLLKSVALSEFEGGRLKAMHEKTDDLELPYFDELARQVGYMGEPLPLVPYGCELHECEATGLKWWFHPFDGEVMFCEGFAPVEPPPLPAGVVDIEDAARARYYASLPDLPF